MKGFSKVLGIVVALVVIAATAQAGSIYPTLNNPGKVLNVAGTVTPDSAFFTIPVDGTHVTSTHTSADTLAAVKLDNLSYSINSNGTATSATVDLIRVSVWGGAALLTTDSLFVFTDFGNTPTGPWNCAAVSNFTPLVVSNLAAAADTAGSAYLRQNRTPLTSLANGGLTCWSGYVSRKFDAAVPSDPLGWKYMRLRLAGDANGPTFVYSVDVNVPTEVAPGIRQ